MKVLVTGSRGFIAKNLIEKLKEYNECEILTVDRNTTEKDLEATLVKADFIYHLAGVNRPENEEEFATGNSCFTDSIINILLKNNKSIPMVLTSSIQAEQDNPYGRSKKAAENLVFEYGKKTLSKVYVYRLPNVFGKWCKPNYNSAVATFCNNIAKGEEVWISDPKKQLTLVYIDDVVNEFIKLLNCNFEISGFSIIPTEYQVTLEHIVNLLKEFKESRTTLKIPDMQDEFTKKLYSTYLSFLPEDEFKYPLKMNIDNRGSFTEFLKSHDRGQVSVNISKPGITKGNHWHHTKNEKFLVVSGTGVIRFRKIGNEEIIEYKVSGDKLEVVDIPVGYTHSIVNTGQTDMVTIMWVNEIFNPEVPDTIYLEV